MTPLNNVTLNSGGSCGVVGEFYVGALLCDSNGDWTVDFSSNEEKGMHFFWELFSVYHGLMLVINNSIQQVISDTNSLKVLHFL